MNNTIKIAILSTAVFLSGCAGPQASFSDKIQDSFLFTSASEVPPTQRSCFTLTQSFVLPSGSVTYSIPAGRYVAKQKNKTGHFYYAPHMIESSNSWLGVDQEGIYLDNQFKHGYLFFISPTGYSNRPIRSNVLPNDILTHIKLEKHC
jgi:hypothetical protein